MGLDAFVRCRCWEEGRTSPPPMPVVLDEDDGVLAPDVAGEVATDDWLKVDDWVATACAHEDMRATSERISNWAGYRNLQHALGRTGWAHFPVLHAELPDSNGGHTDPERARAALDELALFRRLAADLDVVQLVDADDGQVVGDAIPAYDGVFLLSRDERVALTAEATLQVRTADGVLRFTSPEFAVTPVAAGRVRLQDLATGATAETLDGFDGRTHLRVRMVRVGAAHYDYALEPLERVFRTAVAVGNPVHWT